MNTLVPRLIDHDAGVSALEDNARSMFAVLGRGPGGHVTETPNRLVVETPVAHPPYNTVWFFHDDGARPLAEQVGELIGRFRARHIPGMWLVHPTAPKGLRHHLAEHGYASAEEVYGMVADLRGWEAAGLVAPEVEVREACPDDPDDWVHLVSWRYGLDTSASPYLATVFTNAVCTGTRIWIARIGGRPAAKVVLHRDPSGVAGIYGVATTEAARGRGLATMLVRTALQAARHQGSELAVLHSTPMAHSLYRRLGFQDVATFEAWADPGTLHL